MFRADVTPSFTQHHSDVTDVPQAQACALHPEGFAARGAWPAGHPEALIIGARPMRDQVFDRFILTRFPCPSQGAHKAPPTRRIVGVTLPHHREVVLSARGRVALDNHPCGPRRRHKLAHHLTEQGIFCLGRWLSFAPYPAQGHGETLDVPRGHQPSKPEADNPGLRRAFPPFWG
jgi:hypothetical protein